MKRFCLSAESFARSAAVLAGVRPLTSPPITLATFDPRLLDGQDLVTFKLHGLDGQPYWYGDGGITACSADQLAQARLPGALVFVANCWGGAQSPMIQALLAAGAAAIVTGEGLNFAGVRQIDGADVLGYGWRHMVELGFDAETGLRLGKIMARYRRPRLKADIASFGLIGNPAAKLRKENDYVGTSES